MKYLVLIVVFLLFANSSYAEQIEIAPVVDNSIHHDWEDLCGTYPPDYPDIVVQSRASLPSVVHGLLYFDLSSIPQPSNIQSASLRLYCLMETEYVTNEFHVSRVLEAWDTDYVTWCGRSASGAWCEPGGCMTSEGQASVVIPSKYGDWEGGPYEEWIEWDVTDIVTNWHESTFTNYGFCLWQIPQYGHGRNQRVHFASVDNASAGTLAPKLLIHYAPSVPAEESTWGQIKSLFK